MKYFLILLSMTTAFNCLAIDADSLMQDFIWEKRVLLVFTPDSLQENYQRQNAMLSEVAADMEERDMTTIRAMADGTLSIDNNKQSLSVAEFYERYAVNEKQFRVILVGKDSTVKLDRDEPVSAEELFALIDTMPMRHYEMLQDE